jgi:putative hydrolase of the HAD superfamily
MAMAQNDIPAPTSGRRPDGDGGHPGRRLRAVLLDALGTLLYFEPPAPRLRDELRERLGVEVPLETAEAAIKAEIAYYRAHLHEGRDAASLAELRRAAADAMRPVLGIDADLTEALLASLRFHAYPDAAPALTTLRERGLSIVVVSNWDDSLHARLEETGLAPLVDGAVASAELGRAKPDPAIFEHALDLVGADAAGALHAGDTPDEDVAGALAAGLRAVLVARDGLASAPAGVPVIRTLAELPPLCEYARRGP